MYEIFVGTNSVRGSQGIYTLGFDGGALTALCATPYYNAGYLALCGDRLFAASEGMTFQGLASGGVTAFSIAPDGSLLPTGSRATGGQRPCCVCTDGATVWASNFYGGLCPAFPVDAQGRIGPARYVIDEPPLGDLPKALHCVGLLQDGRTLGVVSLSRLSLVLYDAHSGARICEYSPGDGRHPRHFAASPDGRLLFLLMQEPAEVHVLAYETGRLRLLQAISLDSRPLVLGASAIRVSPDGQFVLAAVRDTAELHTLRLASDVLTPLSRTKLPGEAPRDFALTPDGRFVVTALQQTDCVSVHRFDAGALTECAVLGGIPSPASIVIREVEK